MGASGDVDAASGDVVGTRASALGQSRPGAPGGDGGARVGGEAHLLQVRLRHGAGAELLRRDALRAQQGGGGGGGVRGEGGEGIFDAGGRLGVQRSLADCVRACTRKVDRPTDKRTGGEELVGQKDILQTETHPGRQAGSTAMVACEALWRGQTLAARSR